MRTRIVRPKASQLVPLMATGTRGTRERRAKKAAPSSSGNSSRSPAWIRPSPAIATTPPCPKTVSTLRVASMRSSLVGRNGMAVPVQRMIRFRAPFDMSLSFGPKKYSRGRHGRVAMRTKGSVQLWWLKQQQRGSGREPVAALHPDPEEGPDGQPGEQHRQAVAEQLARPGHPTGRWRGGPGAPADPLVARRHRLSHPGRSRRDRGDRSGRGSATRPGALPAPGGSPRSGRARRTSPRPDRRGPR